MCAFQSVLSLSKSYVLNLKGVTYGIGKLCVICSAWLEDIFPGDLVGEASMQYTVSRSWSMVVPGVQYAEEALSNYGKYYGPQCQSNPSPALNPIVGPRAKLGQHRPTSFPTANLIHAPGGYDTVRSRFSLRRGPADSFRPRQLESRRLPLRGLRLMQMGLPYLPGKPQYRSLTTKQSKKFQVQARWKEKFRRLLGREEKIQPVESDSEVTKADGIEGEPVAPPEKFDPQSEKIDPQVCTCTVLLLFSVKYIYVE